MKALNEMKTNLLADGIIDANEAEWLYAKINGDGQVDGRKRIAFGAEISDKMFAC